ncbi:flagellar basal body L-ring protein FlgH [Acidocella aminolytica]|jgi:flagellar L-ring protein precursor FlgH|uniref:Flagellar L-ring protein FlgH n=1 Tax=Acidocella aminolytica 101 = DSM 11237 TaxID=1120923 RepID=A0A0D6PE35_9PROT|nr:flagellar basal body L-ring protein FlgH [Acidocella aminolytica]GAN80035.1 flagellar L-ring protein FlgH [Acidocella aminolytica 101 = DSM 11237]GBQ40599.1 flagellar basal body L-ring protein [Acidocella aminolytica 101 = DSM 11237]SHF08139.1 L-ring protein [Acidocella aminolytica 101 = DSM 11237]
MKRFLPILLLAGCQTAAAPPAALVQPAAFPVTVAKPAMSVDGSVFPASSAGSLYAPRRDWRVGDLVTIDVVTSSSANNTDNAALTRKGTIDDSMTSFMGVPMSFGHINGGSLAPEIGATSDQQYTGTGSASAANNISGQVEAVVTNVDANGILALEGRTNVNINGNVISIVVTGYASPDDIAANTTISSNQVADMNVQYVGIGPISGAHQLPWLQRVLNKLAPF